jgi:DNA invertase Pin-like site-specific DNA recombinase
MPSTNGHGLKRAILYARVSTDEQAKSGYSLAQQIEALKQYAERESYEVLEAFGYGEEVVARELTQLAREAGGPVRKEDLRLRVAAGVE